MAEKFLHMKKTERSSDVGAELFAKEMTWFSVRNSLTVKPNSQGAVMLVTTVNDVLGVFPWGMNLRLTPGHDESALTRLSPSKRHPLLDRIL